jgi:acetate kinase
MNTSATPAESSLVLVLNCGSSSIKCALFDAVRVPQERSPRWKGQVAVSDDSWGAALREVRREIEAQRNGAALAAVSHRIVHGGGRYVAPTIIDTDVLAKLHSYAPLAPLHQPIALEAVATFQASDPGLPQVACFDTAFHHTMPKVEQILPLPRAAWERGLRRYGFHGLSYEYLSVVLPERYGDQARGRSIAAHLGSGASLCAMQALRSVATTMGFSALDGLMMGTRCGSLDPGAVLYLMQTEQLDVEQIGRVLYNESGLAGVSGTSADLRVLLQREGSDEAARDAINLYVRRIVREIGALTAVLGGLELLVFTAGVGEHNAAIRERVCRELAFLGIELDDAANAGHAPLISAAESRVAVAVEPTNEEWIAARAAIRLVGKAS